MEEVEEHVEVNLQDETQKIREAGSKLRQSNHAVLNMRIQDLLKVLSNFAELREESKSRGEYMDELKQAVQDYYSYNEQLVDLFFDLFSVSEAMEFFEANEMPRPLVIRTNTLKTKRRDLAKTLIARGVSLEPLAEWSKVGLKINDSKVPLGATPEYLAGYYILQSASSFLPVMALCPQPGEKILDMAAAPGGKTTYIAQLMKNRGTIIANDMQKSRIKALFANCQRLGVTNTIIINYDGKKLPQVVNNFDRILLDSPCTGMGLIARDPSIKSQKTLKEVKMLSKDQKELILAGIDCLNPHSKTGGYLVYSTCSVTVEENEEVIDYALKNRYVKIVESGLSVGNPGVTSYRKYRFSQSMKLARRIFPHVHNMDGFFVCKLKKYANGPRTKAYDIPEEKGIPTKKREKPEQSQQEEEKQEFDEEKEVIKDKKLKKLEKHKKVIKGEKQEKTGKKSDKSEQSSLPKSKSIPQQKSTPKPKTEEAAAPALHKTKKNSKKFAKK